MKTKAYRKKLMADLKLATKNCIELVEKTHATENEKKFVGQCYFSNNFGIELHGFFHIASIYTKTVEDFFRL